jgi:putative ABC transport system permease protein
MVYMSTVGVWFAFVFVIIALILSLWQKLGLEKEIALSASRTAIQLIAIGYVLQFVFHAEHPLLIALVIAMMIGVASWNAAQRGGKVPGILWRIALTLAVTECVTIGLLLAMRLVDATPQYVIPLSGMMIGNAMVVSGLFLSHMKREVETSRGEIEALLCLGATKRQAIQEVLKRSVKSSMIPTFDTMKTIGLVQLPGTMTGMIIAGASPIEAVRYQILIMFSFSTAAAVTAVILATISYTLWFTKDGYLRT